MKEKHTLLGVFAILIWGLSAAFTRTLGERLGLFTSGAVVNLLGGALICLVMRVKYKSWGNFRAVPKKYLLGCGGLYCAYVLTSYIATIAAHTRQQVLAVVIIKFLWPVFTLMLTIPILKEKASRWIWASCGLSLLGMVVVCLGDAGSLSELRGLFAGAGTILPLALGLVSALCWALYSVLTRKFLEGTKQDVDYLGYFLLATGLLMGFVSLFRSETRQGLGPAMWGELFFQVVFTSFLASLFWNSAMMKGRVVLVATLSNMLPIIAILATSLVLGVPITAPVLAGSLLVTASTFWSKWCFAKKAPKQPKPTAAPPKRKKDNAV